MRHGGRGAVFTTVRDACVVAAACAAVALAVNEARPDGIPLVQKEEYEVFVPCPEPLGNPGRMGPRQLLALPPGGDVLVIDAREEGEFKAWRLPGAVSIPFDYLAPVSPPRLKEVAASGAGRVVVYGDGADPDSGRELARELSGSGIRNVYYVGGGAPALRGAGKGAAP